MLLTNCAIIVNGFLGVSILTVNLPNRHYLYIPMPKLVLYYFLLKHHEIILSIQQSWQQGTFLICCYEGNISKHLFSFRGSH